MNDLHEPKMTAAECAELKTLVNEYARLEIQRVRALGADRLAELNAQIEANLKAEVSGVAELVGEMQAMAAECEKLLDEGVPLRGACLYPILGMPEWHEPETWTRMGLWDLVPRNGALQRELFTPLLESLRSAQRVEQKYAERYAGGDDDSSLATGTDA